MCFWEYSFENVIDLQQLFWVRFLGKGYWVNSVEPH